MAYVTLLFRGQLYTCKWLCKAGLTTGLDEGGYAIMGHDIMKIH